MKCCLEIKINNKETFISHNFESRINLSSFNALNVKTMNRAYTKIRVLGNIMKSIFVTDWLFQVVFISISMTVIDIKTKSVIKK